MAAVHMLEMGQEALVVGGGVQHLLGKPAQHGHRVVLRRLPKVGVQAAEEVYGGVVPAPAEVEGQFAEEPQLLRYRWHDGKDAGGSHVLGSVGESLSCERIQ